MNRQSSEKDGTVRIIIRAHTAYLPPEIRDLVIPLLEQTVRRFRPGGPLGNRHELEVVKHYTVGDDGRLKISAGLVPRIRRHLEDHGYAVRIDGRTNGVRITDADHRVLDAPDLTDEDARFLHTFPNELKGQVLVQRRSEIGRHIALFARCFSDLNIFVVACNQNRVQQLVNAISKHTDRSVTSDSRAVWSHNPRMFVGTMQLFHHSMSEGFHIAIFTDVESVLAIRTANTPDVWHDGAWYAFLESHEGLSDYEQFRLEEVCGPVIFAPIEDQQVATVIVEFVGVHRAGHANTDRGLARKRAMYWHSPSWNGTVAKTAAALAIERSRRTVSILVESSEHGGKLLKQLPQWELLTDNTLTSCIPLVGNRQIATFVYAERWGIGTDILLRADGGSGWPLSTGFPRWAQREDDAVLLIDFEDAVDGMAVKDTKSRRAAYEQLRWDVVRADSGMEDSDGQWIGGAVSADQPEFVVEQERPIPAGQIVRSTT